MPAAPLMFATTAPPEVLRLEAATAGCRRVVEEGPPPPDRLAHLLADLYVVAWQRAWARTGRPAGRRPSESN